MNFGGWRGEAVLEVGPQILFWSMSVHCLFILNSTQTFMSLLKLVLCMEDWWVHYKKWI